MADTLTDTQMGSLYPRDHVVAVLPDRAAVSDARRELSAAGFEEVEVWSPTEVVHDQAVVESERNIFQKLGALISDEDSWAKEYRDYAEKGELLLSVCAPKLDEAERAADILGAFGGHTMRHYGGATVTDLLPK